MKDCLFLCNCERDLILFAVLRGKLGGRRRREDRGQEDKERQARIPPQMEGLQLCGEHLGAQGECHGLPRVAQGKVIQLVMMTRARQIQDPSQNDEYLHNMVCHSFTYNVLKLVKLLPGFRGQV